MLLPDAETFRAQDVKKGELDGKNDCSFIVLDWRREIIFLLLRFFFRHTKGSAVEVNSVIMETCFEYGAS